MPFPAVIADLPDLVALKDACIARMRADGIEQWDEAYPNAAVLARDLAVGTLHVLREGDGILGCVTLDTTRDPLWQGMDWSAAGEPAAAVHRLMVHPAAQGRGLAKLLMAHTAPAPKRCAKGASSASRRCSSDRLDKFGQGPHCARVHSLRQQSS